MYLIVYGPEGSGKGTQAKLLAEKLGLAVLTAGDLVREAALRDKSDIGKMARKVLEEGKYLPDREICILLEAKLKNQKDDRGFILDGFPRSLAQAKFLQKILSQLAIKIDKVIYLKLSDNQAIERLKKRKRRLYGKSKISHDAPERVMMRLAAYRKQERQLLQFFEKEGLLLTIDANQPIEKVFADNITGLNINK